MSNTIAAQWPNLLQGIAETKRALAVVEAQHPEPPPDAPLSSFETVNAYAPIESAKRQILQRNRLLGMARDGLIEHGEGFPPPVRVDQLLRADWWRGRMHGAGIGNEVNVQAMTLREELLQDKVALLLRVHDLPLDIPARYMRQHEPLKPKLARQGLTLHFYATPRVGQRSSYLGPLPG